MKRTELEKAIIELMDVINWDDVTVGTINDYDMPEILEEFWREYKGRTI